MRVALTVNCKQWVVARGDDLSLSDKSFRPDQNVLACRQHRRLAAEAAWSQMERVAGEIGKRSKAAWRAEIPLATQKFDSAIRYRLRWLSISWKRGHSKCGPGSVLRPRGVAMSEWPMHSLIGYASRRTKASLARIAYCASSKSRSSVPSSSTPIEKSLHRTRPRHSDCPACHARRLQGTNCISSPSLRMRKWLETLASAISR